MNPGKHEAPVGAKKIGVTHGHTEKAAPRVIKAEATGLNKIGSVRSLDKEDRRQMIAEAAYYRFINRDEASGSEVDDWLAAEAEVDQMFGFD